MLIDIKPGDRIVVHRGEETHKLELGRMTASEKCCNFSTLASPDDAKVWRMGAFLEGDDADENKWAFDIQTERRP